MRRTQRSRQRPVPTTQIVMLGTGTPRPDPERSGPATAIVVNGTPYLVDFGPGVIRRAAAAYNKGVTALGLAAAGIKTVFLTHMHADHTAGYPDLILTPWILGRKKALGFVAMCQSDIGRAYSITSSAVASSDGGTVRPSIRAVSAVKLALELLQARERLSALARGRDHPPFLGLMRYVRVPKGLHRPFEALGRRAPGPIVVWC